MANKKTVSTNEFGLIGEVSSGESSKRLSRARFVQSSLLINGHLRSKYKIIEIRWMKRFMTDNWEGNKKNTWADYTILQLYFVVQTAIVSMIIYYQAWKSV